MVRPRRLRQRLAKWQRGAGFTFSANATGYQKQQNISSTRSSLPDRSYGKRVNEKFLDPTGLLSDYLDSQPKVNGVYSGRLYRFG